MVETPDSGQVSSGRKERAKKSCLMEEATRGSAVKRRQRRRGEPVTGHLHENRPMVGPKAPQSICTRVVFVASSLSITSQGFHLPPLRISCSYKMHCAFYLVFNICLATLEKISNWELFNISNCKHVLTWCSLSTDAHNTSTELLPRRTPSFLLQQIRRARFLTQKS